MTSVPTRPARRRAAVFGAAVAVAALAAGTLPATAAPAAPNAPAAPSTDIGLYGTQDPTYDGVYRQGLSILAVAETGQQVPAIALSWLKAQQCSGGGFEAYRASTSTACKPGSPVTFSGQDTNSTAIAAMAFMVTNERPAAARALAWLRKTQNLDGSFPYYAGAPGDVNSTALALAAFRSYGTLPGAVVRKQGGATGKNPVQYLTKQQLRCAAPAAVRGALPYQGGGPANDLASSQAMIGLAGGLPVEAQRGTAGAPGVACSGTTQTNKVTVKDAAANYLSRTLVAHDGGLPNGFGPGTDWSATSYAVLGLVSGGRAAKAVTEATASLAANVNAFARDGGGADRPAALGLLVLVAKATGTPAFRFGGVNLNKRLAATLTR